MHTTKACCSNICSTTCRCRSGDCAWWRGKWGVIAFALNDDAPHVEAFCQVGWIYHSFRGHEPQGAYKNQILDRWDALPRDAPGSTTQQVQRHYGKLDDINIDPVVLTRGMPRSMRLTNEVFTRT